MAKERRASSTAIEDVVFVPGGKKLVAKLRQWMEGKYVARTIQQYCNKVEKSMVPFWERNLDLEREGLHGGLFLADMLLFPFEKKLSVPSIEDFLTSEQDASSKKVACLAYKALCKCLEAHVEKK